MKRTPRIFDIPTLEFTSTVLPKPPFGEFRLEIDGKGFCTDEVKPTFRYQSTYHRRILGWHRDEGLIECVVGKIQNPAVETYAIVIRFHAFRETPQYEVTLSLESNVRSVWKESWQGGFGFGFEDGTTQVLVATYDEWYYLTSNWVAPRLVEFDPLPTWDDNGLETVCPPLFPNEWAQFVFVTSWSDDLEQDLSFDVDRAPDQIEKALLLSPKTDFEPSV